MPRSLIILVVGLLVVLGVYYLTMASRFPSPVHDDQASKTAVPSETTTKIETQPDEKKKLRFAAIERAYEAKLHTAVLRAKMSVQCGPNSGNENLATAEQAAAHLVKVMNAANPANPSQNNSRSPTITFALNQGDRDWQVVVLPDDGLNRIVLEGYRDLSSEPVATGEISCR